MAKTGDGVILLFEKPEEAHLFGFELHSLSNERNSTRSDVIAQRWFRIGVSTGDVSRTAFSSLSAEYAGVTIANAVRLETAANPGEIVMDCASFNLLPKEMQLVYGCEETVRGKRTEGFVLAGIKFSSRGSFSQKADAFCRAQCCLSGLDHKELPHGESLLQWGASCPRGHSFGLARRMGYEN